MLSDLIIFGLLLYGALGAWLAFHRDQVTDAHDSLAFGGFIAMFASASLGALWVVAAVIYANVGLLLHLIRSRP